MKFVHLPFSVRSLDLFSRFTLVYEGHFVLCYKGEFLVESSRYGIVGSTWFPMLCACRFVEFVTSVICHVFMHCFGSFQSSASYMFLSLQVFAFKGQKMKLTVKRLFTCILLFTCIVGAFTMAWVWFLNLETVKDVEGNWKSKLSDWNQKWPTTCVSHLGGFFDFRDIRWRSACPGQFHRAPWY